MFGITASKEEYDDYVKLLIDNAKLGFIYKCYFGDIYQIDRRLMPALDYATLFHIGEYRTAENDKYGALTDTEMTLVLAEALRPGGEIHFYTGSFAYDKGETAGKANSSKHAASTMPASSRPCTSSESPLDRTSRLGRKTKPVKN